MKFIFYHYLFLSFFLFAKKRNYTSGNKERNAVTMVVELNGHKEAVSMELNDKCMEHIRVYAKNKIYDL